MKCGSAECIVGREGIGREPSAVHVEEGPMDLKLTVGQIYIHCFLRGPPGFFGAKDTFSTAKSAFNPPTDDRIDLI